MLENQCQYNNSIYPSYLERFCPDPPQPVINGGQYDWDSALEDITPFRHEVTYWCDIARKLKTGEDDDGNDILINDHTMKCEWNQTWSPYDDVSFLMVIKYYHHI